MIVTSDDDSLPDGCRPRQVAGLVISFVNAFNSGDQASLSRIFAWRMDMKTKDERTTREAADWLCTDPPGWKPGKAVVACT